MPPSESNSCIGPPWGAALFGLPERMANAEAVLTVWRDLPEGKRAADEPPGAAGVLNQVLASQVSYLKSADCETCPGIEVENPTADDFQKLEALGYTRLADVVINGYRPDEIIAPDEQPSEEPEDNAGN